MLLLCTVCGVLFLLMVVVLVVVTLRDAALRDDASLASWVRRPGSDLSADGVHTGATRTAKPETEGSEH